MKKAKSILFAGLIYVIVLLTILVLMLFLREADEIVMLILTFSAIVLVISGVYYFLNEIYAPVARFRQKLKSLEKGELLNFKSSTSSLEIQDMEASIQVHVDRLKSIVSIANELADGKYDKEVELQG